MSKATALTMLTGQAPTTVTPSLITPDMPAKDATNEPIETATEQQKDDLQSNRLAIFAKKEAAILKEREVLKKEREELQREKAEANAYKTKGQEFDELAKKDKIAALKMIGWSDTDIINAMAGTEKTEPDPIEAARKAAQEETAKIREELAKEKADLEKSTNLRLIKNLKTDISSQIKAQAEKFEYCAFQGAEAEEQAYHFIVENLKTNGELLSVEDALDMAESYYEERDKAMAALKKRQPKTDESPIPIEAPSSVKQGIPPKSNTPASPTKPMIPPTTVPRRETTQQKKERLIEALRRGGL